MLEYSPTYGIALCRYNISNNKQSEILMIKKRYTYHYFNFIFGKYKKNDDKYLQYLFDNMTFSEKIEILSKNFSKMWYKIFLIDHDYDYNIITMFHNDNAMKHYNTKLYYKKKAKFENMFSGNFNKLQNFINNSTNAETPWEIPKGHMFNYNKTTFKKLKEPNIIELELDCAKREFEEETCINIKEYNILWQNNAINIVHFDDSIKFTTNYYLAYLKNNSTWLPKVKFNSYDQIIEIEQIKWVSLADINLLGLNENYKSILIKTFKTIIKQFKSHVKSYYYNPKNVITLINNPID